METDTYIPVHRQTETERERGRETGQRVINQSINQSKKLYSASYKLVNGSA